MVATLSSNEDDREWGYGREGRDKGNEAIRKRKCTKGILTSRVVMMLLKMRCAERWKGEWRGRKWPRAEVEMRRDLVNCNAQHKIKTSLMVSENALLSARR